MLTEFQKARQDLKERLILNGLPVYPLSIAARYVIDATGHGAEVVRVIEKKADVKLDTGTGEIMGERSMWADKTEQLTVENTKEICPGVRLCNDGQCRFWWFQNGTHLGRNAPFREKGSRINHLCRRAERQVKMAMDQTALNPDEMCSSPEIERKVDDMAIRLEDLACVVADLSNQCVHYCQLRLRSMAEISGKSR